MRWMQGLAPRRSNGARVAGLQTARATMGPTLGKCSHNGRPRRPGTATEPASRPATRGAGHANTQRHRPIRCVRRLYLATGGLCHGEPPFCCRFPYEGSRSKVLCGLGEPVRSWFAPCASVRCRCARVKLDSRGGPASSSIRMGRMHDACWVMEWDWRTFEPWQRRRWMASGRLVSKPWTRRGEPAG